MMLSRRILRGKTKRWMCNECKSICTDGTMKLSYNPFKPSEKVYGCPECMSVNSLELLCDEESCSRHASCGTPTDEGYRNTCHLHVPKKKTEAQKFLDVVWHPDNTDSVRVKLEKAVRILESL